jgi:hypothetical protein
VQIQQVMPYCHSDRSENPQNRVFGSSCSGI